MLLLLGHEKNVIYSKFVNNPFKHFNPYDSIQRSIEKCVCTLKSYVYFYANINLNQISSTDLCSICWYIIKYYIYLKILPPQGFNYEGTKSVWKTRVKDCEHW